MMCPQCKSTSFRESRQCPKFDGEPVCITCCRACEYYNFGHGLTCMYHVRNPGPKPWDEIEKLNKSISYKMRQVEHFYQTNRPKVAEKIEFEVITLMAKKRELEENNETIRTMAEKESRQK